MSTNFSSFFFKRKRKERKFDAHALVCSMAVAAHLLIHKEDTIPNRTSDQVVIHFDCFDVQGGGNS